MKEGGVILVLFMAPPSHSVARLNLMAGILTRSGAGSVPTSLCVW